MHGVARNGAQMAGLVELVLFPVNKTVRIHLQAHQRKEVRIIQIAVIHQHIVVSESHYTVSIRLIMRLHLFGREIPVGTGSVAVQIRFVRAIGSG